MFTVRNLTSITLGVAAWLGDLVDFVTFGRFEGFACLVSTLATSDSESESDSEEEEEDESEETACH